MFYVLNIRLFEHIAVTEQKFQQSAQKGVCEEMVLLKRNKKRALVVDDEVTIQKLLTFSLERAGFEVHSLGDAGMIEREIDSFHPDIIILDIMLPSMDKDGVIVSKSLKENPKYGHIPIILLSAIAYGTAYPTDKIRNSGKADAFVSKPFQPKELAEVAKKLCKM